MCGGNPEVAVLMRTHGDMRTPRDMPTIERGEHADEMLARTATFTFVRDPVSRFVSALIEMRRRGDKFAVAVEKEAMESGRPVVEVAIERQYKQDLLHLNAHIIPQ